MPRTLDRQDSPNGLSSVIETLRDQHEKLVGQRDAALTTVSHLDSEIRRVQNALAALLGEKPPRAVRSRSTSKGLNGPEVTALIEIALRDGPLKEPELKERVNELAKEEGKARKGLGLVLSNVLRSGAFHWNGAKWALKNGNR